MAKLRSNRLIGTINRGREIDDAIRSLEADLATLIGATLDQEYPERIVALREEGVPGGASHKHKGTGAGGDGTEKIDHGDLLNIGTKTHAEIDAHIDAPAPHSGHEKTSNRGVPNGYCPLDSSGKIPSQYIPPISFTLHYFSGHKYIPISIGTQPVVVTYDINNKGGNILYNNSTGEITINTSGTFFVQFSYYLIDTTNLVGYSIANILLNNSTISTFWSPFVPIEGLNTRIASCINSTMFGVQSGQSAVVKVSLSSNTSEFSLQQASCYLFRIADV